MLYESVIVSMEKEELRQYIRDISDAYGWQESYIYALKRSLAASEELLNAQKELKRAAETHRDRCLYLDSQEQKLLEKYTIPHESNDTICEPMRHERCGSM